MDGHEHHKMSESMDHGQMQHVKEKDHGRDVMIVLGEDVHEGVKAMCHLDADRREDDARRVQGHPSSDGDAE
ncbi:MAG: hypothetical protein R2864_05115 [Syntrophotaleaceae bacterium]